jgi:hypothetical protein
MPPEGAHAFCHRQNASALAFRRKGGLPSGQENPRLALQPMENEVGITHPEEATASKVLGGGSQGGSGAEKASSGLGLLSCDCER